MNKPLQQISKTTDFLSSQDPLYSIMVQISWAIELLKFSIELYWYSSSTMGMFVLARKIEPPYKIRHDEKQI